MRDGYHMSPPGMDGDTFMDVSGCEQKEGKARNRCRNAFMDARRFFVGKCDQSLCDIPATDPKPGCTRKSGLHVHIVRAPDPTSDVYVTSDKNRNTIKSHS